MKVIKYICNRCEKSIDPQGLYSLNPYRFDPENSEFATSIPDEIQAEIYVMLEDKHLCLDCLKKTLMFYNAAAVPNPDFTVAIESMIDSDKITAGTINAEQIQSPKVEEKSPDLKSASKVKKTKLKITNEELKEMVESGMSAKQIAETAQMDLSGIYQRIKKLNVPLSPKKPKPGENTEKKSEKKKLTVESAKEEYYAGLTIPELASLFELSLQEMRSFMIRNRISKNAKEYAEYLKQTELNADLGV